MRGLAPVPEAIADLEGLSAEEVLDYAVERFAPRLYVACSFQKEASVFMDMLLRIEPEARFFTLDTGVLFPETYETWKRLEERYGIEIEVYQGISPARQAELHGDELWKRDPDACCEIRKVAPLRERARRGPTPGSPACAASSPPSRAEHPEARLGRKARPVEGRPARRLDREGRLALHRRARRAVQPAARPRLRVDRLRALHEAGPGRDGRWAGSDKRSADCTHERASW